MADVSRVSGRKTLESGQETPSLIDVMAISRERVSEVLLDLRKLHGSPDRPLSQEKAARRADVSERDWGRWERKEVTPFASSLGKVADAFEIPLDEFDDGRVDRSNTPLADRLDEIQASQDRMERLLTALASRLGVDVRDLEVESLVELVPGEEATAPPALESPLPAGAKTS